MPPPQAALLPVRGLAAYWAHATQRGGERLPAIQARILLDMLGLGLEQTLRYLGERPDQATFERWIVATGGLPDPERLARYHAWLDGAAPPPATARRLAAIAAAPDVLDAADLSRWAEHGFVILHSAITTAEAEACALLLWDEVGGTPDDPSSWYPNRPNGIMVQTFQHPTLDVARRAPRVHKAFAQLWGTPDLWSSTDRMSFNPPERPGFTFPGPHLHWDTSLVQPVAFATQGILYLTDTHADQGALQLVPGFHHRLGAWLDEIGDADPREMDLGHAAIPIPARAGDLVIWRQDLPHGASPNRSTRPRMAQYVNLYSPDLVSQPKWR